MSYVCGKMVKVEKVCSKVLGHFTLKNLSLHRATIWSKSQLQVHTYLPPHGCRTYHTIIHNNQTEHMQNILLTTDALKMRAPSI